jgi:hypothetical protein
MTKSMLSEAKSVLNYLEHVPDKYKEGPWSPVTHLIVYVYAGFLLLTVPSAFMSNADSLGVSDSFDMFYLQFFRLLCFLYGAIVIFVTYQKLGVWPSLSYTYTSWNLMTLRFFFSFLDGLGITSMRGFANLIRFPALVGCSITVFIWWGVLIPVIDTFLRRNAKQRANFWDLNRSFLLISVHCLNLPMVLGEFILTNQMLTFSDLWAGYLVAFLYCLFYLNVLVPHGVHFYIILSPQTALCAISYALIIVSYYCTFLLANYILTSCRLYVV